jgi:hypothetical protein
MMGSVARSDLKRPKGKASKSEGLKPASTHAIVRRELGSQPVLIKDGGFSGKIFSAAQSCRQRASLESDEVLRQQRDSREIRTTGEQRLQRRDELEIGRAHV